MSEVANKNFNSSAGFSKNVADLIARLLAIIADYLEKEGKYAAQKEMAKWIKGGGDIISYPIQGDKIPGMIHSLKSALDEQKIPYIEVNDASKIIIRSIDMEKIKEINKELLIARSEYYQIVDSQEMENAISKADFVRDKDIFTLHSLTENEVEVLKNKCNGISVGFMLGQKKNEDNTYDVSVHASKIFNTNESDRKHKDFCKAFLETYLSLYGANRDIKVQELEYDRNLDAQISSLKGTKTPHYIVSANTNKRYIELNNERFVFHNLVKNGNEVVDRLTTCDVTDPDYEQELEKCKDKLLNKTIISDQTLLNKHLSSSEHVVTSSRPVRDRQQNNNKNVESLLGAKIDSMVKEKIKAERKMFDSPAEAFSEYVKEASVILGCARTGVITTDYKQEDMAEIQNIFFEHESNAVYYKDIPDKMLMVSHDMHQAQYKKIEKSIEKNTSKSQKNEKNRNKENIQTVKGGESR